MTITPHHQVIDLNLWNSLFDKNHNRPYYSVLGKRYDNKLTAILAAKDAMRISNATPWEVIKWHAFDELYNIDFSIEPNESYSDLCIKRARQLREKYDYVRLYYSGGPDSHTTLRSFYEAGATIDEIVIIRNTTIGINAPGNIENTALTIPSINKIKDWFPNTKINLLEFVLDTNMRNETSDQILSRAIKTEIVTPTCRTMALAFDLDKSMLNVYNKNVCEISGEPKPCLIKKNGKWYSYIIDNQIGTSLLLPQLELFHLSSDFPQLFIKQCHMLRRHYDTLMVNHTEQHSMIIDRDLDRKNKFLERYNEWDTNNYIEAAHRIQKFRTNKGDHGVSVYTMRNLKNNTQFADFLKWLRDLYWEEFYNPNKDFFDNGYIFANPTGMLSNFWCLDEFANKTTDQLFPLGFGVYK